MASCSPCVWNLKNVALVKYHLKVLLEHLPNQFAEIDNYLEKYYSDDIRETQLDKDFEKLTNRILKSPSIIDPITEVYKIKEELQKRQELKNADKAVNKKPKSEK